VAQRKLIVNLARDTAVCDRCTVADGPLSRMRGLIGRRELPAGEGMLLRPAPVIHTGLMRFPIDAVFMDDGLRVLRVVERLRPWRAARQRGATAVLELAAGEGAARGLQVGDRLVVVAGPAPGAADSRRSEEAHRERS
jgi:uncharacterized membrane protein (UPF0127 family)